MTIDLHAAMKAKDVRRVSVLRMVVASMKNAKIASKKELSDADVVALIQRELKQKRETFEHCRDAGRLDLCERENEEIGILEAYLPKQLSREEVSVIVDEAIGATNAKTKKEMGKVMGLVMPKVKGRVDGNIVQQIVQEKLS